MENNRLEKLNRQDSLAIIQKYVQEKMFVEIVSKTDVANEMFRLFFSVMELGKSIRTTLKYSSNQNTEYKIGEIFLCLITICNNLNIDLFTTLESMDKVPVLT